MQPNRSGLVDSYNDNYLRSNYFRYKEWMYRPYIKALAKKTGLKEGSGILDAGCGQGFFTWLFADLGFNALGVDISVEGIRTAQREYGSSSARYAVGDIQCLEFAKQFDCVFTRSCSLFNSAGFSSLQDVTNTLMSYIRPGGVLIFDYYTKLSPWKNSSSWIYHSLQVVREHFSHYSQAEILFSLRVESIVFGSLALTSPLSAISAAVSHCTGVGGELLALVRKE